MKIRQFHKRNYFTHRRRFQTFLFFESSFCRDVNDEEWREREKKERKSDWWQRD